MGRVRRELARECWLCGKNGCHDPLDKHHIFGGANRKKSEHYGLYVYLCHNSCHLNGPDAAHRNLNTIGAARESPMLSATLLTETLFSLQRATKRL